MSEFLHLCKNERYTACSDDVVAYLPQSSVYFFCIRFVYDGVCFKIRRVCQRIKILPVIFPFT